MLFLSRLFFNALGVLLVTFLVPGVFVRSFWTALLAALVIGLVNAVIRPLVLLISLPVTLLTLGLFPFVINALMFWLASAFVPGFYVEGFRAAFWGGLVFWLVSWTTNTIIREPDTII